MNTALYAFIGIVAFICFAAFFMFLGWAIVRINLGENRKEDAADFGAPEGALRDQEEW